MVTIRRPAHYVRMLFVGKLSIKAFRILGYNTNYGVWEATAISASIS